MSKYRRTPRFRGNYSRGAGVGVGLVEGTACCYARVLVDGDGAADRRGDGEGGAAGDVLGVEEGYVVGGAAVDSFDRFGVGVAFGVGDGVGGDGSVPD